MTHDGHYQFKVVAYFTKTCAEGMEELDDLEDTLTKYFDNYYEGTDEELGIPIRNNEFSSFVEGGYMARLLQKGDWINQIDSLTDDFVQAYSVQEGN